MINIVGSKKHAHKFTWLAIFLSLILPSICLDYQLTIWHVGYFTIPYGQYIFFVLTVLTASVLFLALEREKVKFIIFQKKLWIFFTLFLLGFLISSPSMWGGRLFLIICSVSFSMIIIAIYILQNEQSRTPKILLFLLAPFAIPVYGAIFLEYIGPLEIGFQIENIKHVEYNPPRWYFLYSSANGFGFSAALITVASYTALALSKQKLSSVIYFVIGLLAFYALLSSGTRAAYIFALSAILSFHFLYLGLRSVIWALGGLIFCVFVLIFAIGLDDFTSFLRLDDLKDIEKISSGRWFAIREMWKLFAQSPLSGIGFGSADNNFPIYPANIFYFALPVEIGALGFLGILGLLGLPYYYIIKQMMLKKHVAVLSTKSYLCVLSVCVLSGFVPYLMFEFNILRVSGVNQLFFFFWGIAMVEFGWKNKSDNA